MMLNKTKAKYKLAVQKLIYQKQKLIADKVAANNCEIYKYSSNSCRNIIAPSKNNNAESDDQLKMWYSHFHTEFNGRKSPSTELQKESITKDTRKEAIQFNMHDLEKVICNSIARSLKKSYEHNYHILHAPKIALENILLGLNEWCKDACVKADMQPFDFLTSKINPIPKTGPRDLSMVKSWRPICCSSTVCFLFEKMLLDKLKPYLNTTDCQFAYKPNHGCLQPISIVREAEQKVSDFHVALLDATAAFDRISWKRIKK